MSGGAQSSGGGVQRGGNGTQEALGQCPTTSTSSSYLSKPKFTELTEVGIILMCS